MPGGGETEMTAETHTIHSWGEKLIKKNRSNPMATGIKY